MGKRFHMIEVSWKNLNMAKWFFLEKRKIQKMLQPSMPLVSILNISLVEATRQHLIILDK